MQLSGGRETADGRQGDIRQALALAACSLLGAGASSQAVAAPWDVDSAVLFYSEADNRVSAVEPVVSAKTEIGDDEFFRVKAVFDALTGASPNGATPTDRVQTFTRPSGNGGYTAGAGEIPLDDSFRDARGSVSVSWDKPLGRLSRRTLGASVSQESDYTSLSANGRFSRDFNSRNTTLVAGASLAVDIIRPTGNVPTAFASMAPPEQDQPRDATSDDKTTLDLLVGVTQVLGHDTIAQINYSFGLASGYLDDPYKILSVIDGATGKTLDYLYEKRPDRRQKHALYGELKHYLGRDVISGAYRFYRDDWGVVSHTIELGYRWNLDERNYLQPALRWYSQTAVDFYRHSLIDGEPLPTHASADPRLAEYDAATIGLKFGHDFDANSGWRLRVAWYQQQGADHPVDVVGLQKNMDLFPETRALIVQAGYRYRW